MYKYLVIDDEEDARQIIKHLMSDYFPKWKCIGEAGNKIKAVNLLNSNDPDLVFMDIKLHHDTGFEILEESHYFEFFTIFITAYKDFSIQAFDYNVSGYLLKPIDLDEFKNALNKLEKLIISSKENVLLKKNNSKITLHTNEYIHMVNLNELIRIESEGNYSFFYMSNGEKHVISKYLKEAEELVNDSSFLRVHNSHIINLEHIKAFKKEEGGLIIMSDGSQVPVSRRKREQLLEYLA